MRKTIKAVVFVIGMLLLLTGCSKSPVEQDTVQGPPGGNKDDYGQPYKIWIKQYDDNEKLVSFGLIADSHIDASNALLGSYRDTENVKHNRHVIECLNIDVETTANCHGIVHLGDMVDANNTQNLVAFRQLYEKGYPGIDGGAIAGKPDDDYDAYSQGYRINRHVFPTIGNHDDPYYKDDPKDWRYAEEYVRDLIEGAEGIISCHDHALSGAYAWRWGQYFFIQLGAWAGSHEYESNTKVDTLKLKWLKEFLENNVGDSNLGVLIFQHYGWDQDGSQGFWNSEMKNLELDVLMRRPLGSGNNVQGNPYNIIAIFSGHTHDRSHINVYAGLDAHGDSVYFDNQVIDDSGEQHWHYGYSIVTLTGDEMKIHTKFMGDGGSGWRWYTRPIHVGL
jgi:hypothetical protein